jgi:hypothetical protein
MSVRKGLRMAFDLWAKKAENENIHKTGNFTTHTLFPAD